MSVPTWCQRGAAGAHPERVMPVARADVGLVSSAPVRIPFACASGSMNVREQTGVVHDLPRARQLLRLEFGSRVEFENPSLEYRRLFSELLGTFFLVLAAAGGGILHAKGQISLAAAVVAPALMVMGVILFMGAISGAHLNPGVSIAFAVRHDFPWRRVPG